MLFKVNEALYISKKKNLNSKNILITLLLLPSGIDFWNTTRRKLRTEIKTGTNCTITCTNSVGDHYGPSEFRQTISLLIKGQDERESHLQSFIGALSIPFRCKNRPLMKCRVIGRSQFLRQKVSSKVCTYPSIADVRKFPEERAWPSL